MTKDAEVYVKLAMEYFRRIGEQNVPPEQLLMRAAHLASKARTSEGLRDARNRLTFQHNQSRCWKDLSYSSVPDCRYILEPSRVQKCVATANDTLEFFQDISMIASLNLWELLGLRNMSGFVGEVFAAAVREAFSDKLMANPNQDGYPDLMALTEDGRRYVDSHTDSAGMIDRNKALWNSYPYGGVEIKATCGNVPAASQAPKPKIGESRTPNLTSVEWKAHHQQTKTLLGVFWDFVDSVPTVLAVFFRNDLDTSVGSLNKDWGATIVPSQQGGRTTSVSIMRRGRGNTVVGVRKMAEGWMILPSNEELAGPIRRVFRVPT